MFQFAQVVRCVCTPFVGCCRLCACASSRMAPSPSEAPKKKKRPPKSHASTKYVLLERSRAASWRRDFQISRLEMFISKNVQRGKKGADKAATATAVRPPRVPRPRGRGSRRAGGTGTTPRARASDSNDGVRRDDGVDDRQARGLPREPGSRREARERVVRLGVQGGRARDRGGRGSEEDRVAETGRGGLQGRAEGDKRASGVQAPERGQVSRVAQARGPVLVDCDGVLRGRVGERLDQGDGCPPSRGPHPLRVPGVPQGGPVPARDSQDPQGHQVQQHPADERG